MSDPEKTSSSAPPSGSVITVADTPNGKELMWRPANRHPLQWMVVGFGAMCVVMTFFFVAIVLSGEMTSSQSMPENVDPLEGFSPLFLLPHLLMGLYMMWAGMRKGRPQQVVLEQTTFCYDTGSPALPIPLGWFFSPMMIYGNTWFGTSGANNPFSFSRKRYAIPVGQLTEFKLERIGERQRLTVDHGADRIEIGAVLREPEREWLAATLQKWRRNCDET